MFVVGLQVALCFVEAEGAAVALGFGVEDWLFEVESEHFAPEVEVAVADLAFCFEAFSDGLCDVFYHVAQVEDVHF